jgi:hypothetical protein
MALLRALVTIPRDTGLPEDVSVNTWHFSTTETSPYSAARTAIGSALQTFYSAVDQLFSSVTATPVTLRFYDLGEPQPRTPLAAPATVTFVPDTGTVVYPEECAIALSFQGSKVSGVPQARRRGRVYLGPLSGIGAIVAGRTQVPNSVTGVIAAAGGGLLAASESASTWKWVVYSPTSAAEGMPGEAWYTAVKSGWVDNAFDVQRRRGPAPTFRSTF